MTWNSWAMRKIGAILLTSAAVASFTLWEGPAPRRAPAGEPTPTRPSLSDPDHLWNRIRSRLHVRVESEIARGPDRPAVEPNEHDPLHWSRIWFPEPVDDLLKGVPHREAVALLDEFLTRGGERLES